MSLRTDGRGAGRRPSPGTAGEVQDEGVRLPSSCQTAARNLPTVVLVVTLGQRPPNAVSAPGMETGTEGGTAWASVTQKMMEGDFL